MKCQLDSAKTHDVMINRRLRLAGSYRDICGGEKKKVHVGFNPDPLYMWVENNTLIPGIPTSDDFIGEEPSFANTWEVLLSFFSLHNIEANWLNCHWSWGYYNEELGGWTGCVGKVRHLIN